MFICEKCGMKFESWSSAYMLVHYCIDGWKNAYKKEYEEEKSEYGSEVFKVNRRKLIYDIKPKNN